MANICMLRHDFQSENQWIREIIPKEIFRINRDCNAKQFSVRIIKECRQNIIKLSAKKSYIDRICVK